MAVDGHPCLLEGLARVFDQAAGIELVLRAHTAEAALAAVDGQAPDVAILELLPSDAGGLDAVELLAEAMPDTTTVIYSAYGDRGGVTDALSAGVRGYVLKSSPADDLLRAIRSVYRGEAWVDPALSPMLLMDPTAPGTPMPHRERRVLELLAAGLRTEDVADRIGVSPETIKADTKRAIARLRATGRVHAVATAIRRSYIG